jgi:hypothetical protein
VWSSLSCDASDDKKSYTKLVVSSTATDAGSGDAPDPAETLGDAETVADAVAAQLPVGSVADVKATEGPAGQWDVVILTIGSNDNATVAAIVEDPAFGTAVCAQLGESCTGVSAPTYFSTTAGTCAAHWGQCGGGDVPDTPCCDLSDECGANDGHGGVYYKQCKPPAKVAEVEAEGEADAAAEAEAATAR